MAGDVNIQEVETTLTKRLFLVSAITVVLIAGMLALLDRSLFTQIKNAMRPLGAGDTPVVLIGDSMKFKAGEGLYPWLEDTKFVSYHTSQPNPPAVIVVKSDSGSDTDVLRVDVPTGPWEVDEYVAGNSIPVASISPYQPMGLSAALKNPQVGALCPVVSGSNKVELDYVSANTSPTGGCTGTPVSFSQISIVVTTAPGVTQTVGTLNCLNATGSSGKCKIVFRE